MKTNHLLPLAIISVSLAACAHKTVDVTEHKSDYRQVSLSRSVGKDSISGHASRDIIITWPRLEIKRRSPADSVSVVFTAERIVLADSSAVTSVSSQSDSVDVKISESLDSSLTRNHDTMLATPRCLILLPVIAVVILAGLAFRGIASRR